MPHHATLVVPAETASIRLVQALTAELALALPFDDHARRGLGLAVEEALAEIIGQSFSGGETGDVEVQLEAGPRALRVVFKDRGLPFDFASIPEYDPRADLLGDAADAGLSKFLLTSSVDTVHFRNLGRGGTELELVKLYSTRAISQYEEAAGGVARPPEPRPGEAVTEVRPFRPEDAIAISRLIYLSYGNSYVYEDMYYPERIVALHEEGMLQSFVALTGRGRLVGHVALALPWPGATIVEWGIAVVDPVCRGGGVMKRLMALLEEEVRRRGFIGVYAHAVTNHDFTQKLCASYGYGDTALLLGYAPATLVFRKITEAPTQRESTFISWRPLGALDASMLRLPPVHGALLRRLYAGIGVALPACAGPGAPTAEATLCRTSVASSLNTATMMIDAVGPDVAPALRGTVRRLCLQRVDVIFAYLDLADPGAPAACVALEGAGFFVGGIFPGHPFPHTLVLQYPNNVSVDCEQVKAYSPLAQELRAYVAREQAAREAVR